MAHPRNQEAQEYQPGLGWVFFSVEEWGVLGPGVLTCPTSLLFGLLLRSSR